MMKSRVGPKLAPARRIALFMPKFAWPVRAGIARYAGPPMLWDVINYERNLPAFRKAGAWRPHGMIGMFGRADLARQARSIAIPAVNIHGGRAFSGFVQVGCDHEKIGAVAAEHLRSLGFSNYACMGFPGEDPNLDLRIGGFLRKLEGQPVEVFEGRKIYPPYETRRGVLIEADDEMLHRWVRWLRKPCAVFASGDLMAARILRACRHLGIRVPEEMAIVGVGDTPELCLDQPVALSSVSLPWEQIGHEAAVQLDRRMSGCLAQPAPILYHPLGVVVRRSSDGFAVGDAVVAELLRFIRAHACEGIRVLDLLGKVPLGRRGMERRFRAVLGRSPHEEIVRVRLEKVVQMLGYTNATLEVIAEETGCGTASRLSAIFRKHYGQSPGSFRKQIRPPR